MPLTPLHLGPAFLLGAIFRKRIHFLSLLAASVIVDLEPLFVILSSADYSLHGVLHSFLGTTLLCILLVIAINQADNLLRTKASFYEPGARVENKKLIGSALIGGYSHIILDSILYTDIRPLYPLDFNPLLGIIPEIWVYWFCLVAFPIAIIVYLLLHMRA